MLVTGGTGRLGRELVKVYPGCLHPTREELGITDEHSVRTCVGNLRPELLIHTAALTDIRECEHDKPKAYLANVQGTRNLVRAVADMANPFCTFAYISTASVFSCEEGNYVETDTPDPKNFYSLTKLLGEFVVSESRLTNWLVIRTNFVAREKWAYPKAFVDRYANYLFADDLAKAIKDIIDRGLRGIVHVCGDETRSMYDLAKITTSGIQPMTLKDYSGPPLPVNMSLRSIRISPFKLTR